MIAISRKRPVQCIYQLILNWSTRGSGIAWINTAHKPTSFPLYDSMVGALYSKKACVSTSRYTADFVGGSDGFKELIFEWVDEDGNVIDEDDASGTLTVSPNDGAGYRSVALIGVPRRFNTLPAGLKQRIVDHPPTTGTFDAEIGFTSAVAWMTLFGNNLS